MKKLVRPILFLSILFFLIPAINAACPPLGQYQCDFSYCNPLCPCGEGEGDCDDDTGCQDGLVCKENIGADYGCYSNVDICVKECPSEFNPVCGEIDVICICAPNIYHKYYIRKAIENNKHIFCEYSIACKAEVISLSPHS